MRLERLRDADIAAYVIERFRGSGRSVGDALNPLLQAAEGHPQRAMLLAHRLWAEVDEGETATLARLGARRTRRRWRAAAPSSTRTGAASAPRAEDAARRSWRRRLAVRAACCGGSSSTRDSAQGAPRLTRAGGRSRSVDGAHASSTRSSPSGSARCPEAERPAARRRTRPASGCAARRLLTGATRARPRVGRPGLRAPPGDRSPVRRSARVPLAAPRRRAAARSAPPSGRDGAAAAPTSSRSIESVEHRLDVRERAERIEPLAAALQLAGRLRAAEHQDGEHRELGRRQRQRRRRADAGTSPTRLPGPLASRVHPLRQSRSSAARIVGSS